ncbi:MAG: HDOD domain-containing protein [Sandaracinaceae bacterium]|nr:hypothetical protein [Myxococcales bacterium]
MHALDKVEYVEAAPVAQRAWLARQPILDRHGATYAYELLFRSGPTNRAIFSDGSQAAAQTIMTAFAEMDLGEVVGRGKAFFNVTREVLLSPAIEALPKHRVVLEVLETVHIDDALIARMKELRDGGFHLAIDDFGLRDELWALVDLADVVKVDLLPLDDAQLEETTRRLKSTGVKLLAEKVETREQHERVRELGYDYFQGYFFQVPEMLSAQKLPQARLETMQLMAKVQREDTPLSELERLISADAALSYRLLRLLASAAYARAHKVDSVHRAIVMLGRQKLSQWVTLLALAGLDDQPPALLATAMLRARMCELLGEQIGRHDPATFYSAGLFSLLDVMMGRPMKELLASMPISRELEAALLKRKGTVGATLRAVADYEQGEWRSIDLVRLPPEDFADAYFAAVRWSAQVMGELGLI